MESRQSSIHIEGVTEGSFLHNSRDVKVSYLVDKSDKNECNLSSNDSFILFHKLKKEATENYTKRTKQKMQKSTIFLKEAILNLQEHHTLKDLEPIKQKLENYGFKVIQMSIHRDEGHQDENKNLIKNYHAHVTMFNLREDGTTIKLGKNYRTELSKLQTFTAEVLRMERGGCSVKEHAKELGVETTKAARRLSTYDYKRAMQLKEEDFKNIKIEVTKLQEKEQKYIYNYREMQQKITSLESLDAEQKKELHKLNSAAKKNSSLLWDLYQQIQELKNTPPVIKEVIKEVEVKVEVEVIKEVEVKVEVEVIKEVKVEVEVIKEVKVEVEVIKEVEVKVEVEVIKEVKVEVEVIKEVIKEVEVEVIKEVIKEVEVKVEVEVIKEVIKEVEVKVEVEVIKEVIKEVEVKVEVEVIKEVKVEVENPVNMELEKERNKYKNVVISINRNQKKMIEMVKDLEVKETDGWFIKVAELFESKDKEIKKLQDRFGHIIKQEEIENKNKEELNEIKQKFIEEYMSHNAYSLEDTKAGRISLADKKQFKQIINIEIENNENKTLVLLALKYKKLEQVQQRQEQEQVQQKEQQVEQVEQQSGYSPYSR